jgi:predicted flap endonuclease-1-like 5' DNA nuclease
MWFLIIQILLLMLLAAFLGAWLAWWWTQRNFEDITESYEDLHKASGKIDFEPVETRLTSIETAISSFKIPDPDYSPLSTRLDALTTKVSGPNSDLDAIQSRLVNLSDRMNEQKGPDLEPMEARLSRIEEKLSGVDTESLQTAISLLDLSIKEQEFPQTDLSHVHAHIESLTEKVEALKPSAEAAPSIDMDAIRAELQGVGSTDLSPVFERMSGVERAVVGLKAPEVDLSGILEQLDRLEAKVAEPVVFDVPTAEKDFEALYQRLQGIEHNLHEINTTPSTPVDLSGVEQRMTALENFLQSPNPDFDILHTRLTALENSITAIDTTATDLTPFYARFSAIDSALQAMRADDSSQPALDNLEHRLTALQETMAQAPQIDMGPVITSIRSVESRLDIGALEDRLTAIEYGLAAMHHMLRSRQEPPTYTPPPAPEYVRPRPPAPQQNFAMPPRPQPPRQTYVPPAQQPVQQPPQRRDIDVLGGARRQGDQANLLTGAAFGEADNLEVINGVGPMLSTLLNDIGVFYFWQIAEWTPENIDYVDDLLQHFPGRIQRDDWVGQAQILAIQPGAARHPSQQRGY